MRALLVLAVLGLAVPGCAQEDPLSSCGASGFAELIGQPFDDVEVVWPERTRVLRPGEVATTDYLPDRLSVELDAEDRIVSLRCG